MITPEQVINYTSYESVKNRTPAQIKFDIVQAREDIFKYCGQDFSEYEELPEEVELAFIKVAEYYAIINSDEGMVKGMTSETLGDYSYTLGNGEVQELKIGNLLQSYIKETARRGTTFRMRSL